MKKALSMLLALCLALAVPMLALADGAQAEIKSTSYTWHGQKVTKPVFSGSAAKAMNEIMDDTYREFQFIGGRATNNASKPGIEIGYTVYHNADGLLSMSVDETIASPVEPYPSAIQYFILFDLNAGVALHWEDLFAADIDGSALLLDAFNKAVKVLEDWDEEYCAAISELPAFDAFYLSDGKLIAVYAPGAIQPEEAGTFEFSIPLSILKAAFSEDSALYAIAPDPAPAADEQEPAEAPSAEVAPVLYSLVGNVMYEIESGETNMTFTTAPYGIVGVTH